MSLAVLIKIVPSNFKVSEFRGEKGIWLGANTLFSDAWRKDQWLLLRGTFWEGIDQVTGAKAQCGSASLPVASDLNAGGRAGSWCLGILLEFANDDQISLTLPYAITQGLYCTSASYLAVDAIKIQSRISFITRVND